MDDSLLTIHAAYDAIAAHVVGILVDGKPIDHTAVYYASEHAGYVRQYVKDEDGHLVLTHPRRDELATLLRAGDVKIILDHTR